MAVKFAAKQSILLAVHLHTIIPDSLDSRLLFLRLL
jgi:hypothetical protein